MFENLFIVKVRSGINVTWDVQNRATNKLLDRIKYFLILVTPLSVNLGVD